ncbi:MAG: helix-turn-helix domain-containing protein [Oligoflexia bacterium]|nr:helix-turn-helix domain-containing protein [Oligoflexia bacterium]
MKNANQYKNNSPLISSINKNDDFKSNNQDDIQITTSTNDIDDIGSYLRNARDKKGMTLEEVSRRTKILLTILKELEKNNLTALPDKTYIKGFVKAYAKEVGLNVLEATDVLFKSYSKLYGTNTNTSENLQKNNEKLLASDHLSSVNKKVTVDIGTPHAKEHSLRSLLIFIVIASIICFPIYYFYDVIHSSLKYTSNIEFSKIIKNSNIISSKSKSGPTNPYTTTSSATSSAASSATTITANSTTSFDIETNLPTDYNSLTSNSAFTMTSNISPQTSVMSPPPSDSLDNNNSNNINSEIISANNDGKEVKEAKEIKEEKDVKDVKDVKENKLANQQQLDMNIRFRKMVTPSYRLIENGEDLKNENIFPKHVRDAYSSSMENVYIKAVNGDSWITYKKDSEAVQSIVLRKGRGLFVKGSDVRVFVGNANATKIFYNNKFLDAGSGPKSLVFPAANASKYATPMFVRLKDGQILTSDEYQQKTNQEKQKQNEPTLQ